MDRRLVSIASSLLLLSFLADSRATGQTQTGSFGVRPFVIGMIPVVGRSGAVGGVSIDTKGVLRRAEAEVSARLREVRERSREPVSSKITQTSTRRNISLRRLEAALTRCIQTDRPVTEEMQNLAGLQHIEFVFVYPEDHDIVFAGPAEGWNLDAAGENVGVTTRLPPLQLDDLVVALRSADDAGQEQGITCSIDPTADGIRRLQKLLNTRGLTINQNLVERLEETLGPQTITITGVPATSHFAQTMLAADYLMKRLAMNLERAPVDSLPSYLELLQSNSRATANMASPRWWMTMNYEPLLKSADGLAWQFRGPAVKAMSEDGFVKLGGQVVAKSRPDPLAQKWADIFTEKFAPLSTQLPPLAGLRNCMDLALLGALIHTNDLASQADYPMTLWQDERRLGVAQYYMPKSVDSECSLLPKGRKWIVTVSGGVSLDSWAAASRVEVDANVAGEKTKSQPPADESWWWDSKE